MDKIEVNSNQAPALRRSNSGMEGQPQGNGHGDRHVHSMDIPRSRNIQRIVHHTSFHEGAREEEFGRAASLDVNTDVLRSHSLARHSHTDPGDDGHFSKRPDRLSFRKSMSLQNPFLKRQTLRRENTSLSCYETVLKKEDTALLAEGVASGCSQGQTSAITNDKELQEFRESLQKLTDPELNAFQRFLQTGAVPLHPNSFARMSWDGFMFIITAYALISDPVSIAFTNDTSPSSFLNVTDRIVTVFFMLDIILNFLTGYIDKKEQRVIMHYRPVAYFYAKGWLILDLVSSLPPEAFTGFTENSMVKGARVSKILRCFKISRLARIVQVLQLNLDVRLSHFMWKIIVWISCCFIWLHWTTCAECWVWTSVNSDYRIIDLPTGGNALGGDPSCMASTTCTARYYLRGLRTAVAFMCGHDQATGSTYPEDILAVICSLSGSVLYSSFIAVCISLLMEMDAERVRYMGQVERLNHYMGRRKVPLELRQRVREYMEMRWMTNGGSDEKEVLEYVSRSLRRELTMHNAEKLVRGVPFLNTGAKGFVFSVVQVLKPETFLQGDDIMISGEIGQEMFLLEKGILNVIAPDGVTVLESLSPGAWFGEIALQHRTIRTTTIRAQTDGTLYVLEREDYARLLPFFPEMEEELRLSTTKILEHARISMDMHSPGSSMFDMRQRVSPLNEYLPPSPPLTPTAKSKNLDPLKNDEDFNRNELIRVKRSFSAGDDRLRLPSIIYEEDVHVGERGETIQRESTETRRELEIAFNGSLVEKGGIR